MTMALSKVRYRLLFAENGFHRNSIRQVENMLIHVKVATVLLKKANPPLPKSEFSLNLDGPCDVASLVEKLGIPKNLVGSITVNKRRKSPDHVLSEGDTIAIIPAISGG